MKKYPRSGVVNFPKLFKVFLAAEIVAIAGSYFVWNRMNRSRSFRKTVLEKFPYILEGYYSLGEKLDSTNNIRELDSQFWDYEKKQSR